MVSRILSILILATTNDATEVEMRLRTSCQRMKIVEPQKLIGAHMIFTKESGLAIRVYYPEDLKRLDEALLKERPTRPEDIYKMLEKWHRGTNAASHHDIDGLTAFRKHFGYAFVICVLPVDERSSYLDRPDSILHRIQRVMGSSDENTYKSVSLFLPLGRRWCCCSSCRTARPSLPTLLLPVYFVNCYNAFIGENIACRGCP